MNARELIEKLEKDAQWNEQAEEVEPSEWGQGNHHGKAEAQREIAAELRAALPEQPQDGASAHWWWRDSTNEWVLEICASGEDHNACVRYSGKTKDDAIEKLVGDDETEKPLSKVWREDAKKHRELKFDSYWIGFADSQEECASDLDAQHDKARALLRRAKDALTCKGLDINYDSCVHCDIEDYLGGER